MKITRGKKINIDMGKYNITKKSYPARTWMWDGEAEVLLSLFAKRLCEIRKLNYNAVCKDILERYLRKKPNSKIGTTQIMRHALNKK